MTHQARVHGALRGEVDVEGRPLGVIRKVFTGKICVEPVLQPELPP